MKIYKVLKTSLLLSPLFFLAQFAHSADQQAIFAGGCFWCVEADFEKQAGVLRAESGYTGGHSKNPDYKAVSAGGTGHYEAVRVTYNPEQVSYDELLALFWVNIDPFDDQGQFCDKGPSYRSAIFVGNGTEREAAEHSKAAIQQGFEEDQQLVTPILEAATFYPAEDYHQDYYKKNATRYKFYRWNCGRDQRLEEIWGKEKG